MSENAFLVDTTKCSGCRACQVACKQWNNLPAENSHFFAGPELTNPAELTAITFNHVKFFPLDRTNPERPVWSIMHKKCYHCEDANCLKVCPQHAIHKLDGWTVINQEQCIGCGACETACVYKVPHVLNRSLEKYGSQQPLYMGKSYKCHACTANRREVPACAFHCSTGALTYGNRFTLLKRAEERVAQVRRDYPNASIYGKDQFGGLNVLTILKDRPDKFGLPVNPERISAARAENIRNTYAFLSLFTFGMPSFKRAAYRLSRSLNA